MKLVRPRSAWSRLARGVPRISLALAFLAISGVRLSAQQAGGTTLTGIVKDVLTGQPIEGANVTLAGTQRGASTKADGRYTITGIPAGVFSVEVRRVSYQLVRQSDIKFSGTGTQTLNLDMSQTSFQLQAVTSSATVDPISGVKAPFAVAKLDASDFAVPTTGAALSIADKVPGVSVIRSSGDPSAEPWVQLRSMSSPFKNNGPLWVIDGIPLNTTQSCTAPPCNINSINTSDIQSLDIASVEVIKGAAAAAQYGSAAAGGVISITTNRGKDVGLGTATLTARNDFGYDAVPQLPKKRTVHQFLVNSKGQWINSNGVVVSKGSRGTDPDRMMDNPYVQTYDNVGQALQANQAMISQVKLEQNSVTTNYSISYNRTSNPGIVRNATGNLDQNVRFNLQHQFRDNLDFTLGLNHSAQDANAQQTSFSQLFSFDPDVNLLRPDITGAKYVILPDTGSSAVNPLYLQILRDNGNKTGNTDFSSSGRFKPFGWLTFDGQIGYRRGDNNGSNYTPAGSPDTDGAGLTDGSLSYSEQHTDIANGSVGGTVLRDVGALTTRVRLGVETSRDRSQLFNASGTTFTTTGIKDLAGATNKTNSSTLTESRVNSVVGSGALDYGGRYVFNGTLRHEGNSLFGPKHRYNNFYGAGVSWIFSNETWYPAFLDPISTFKLRYNYGTAGTKPDFVDQYETITLSTGGGFIRSGLGNRDLEPEVKTDHEVGLDWLIKNRVAVAYTFVSTKTRGAIVGVEAPASSGFNTYTKNAGGTHGYSHELSFEGAVIERPNGFRWSTTLEGSRSATAVDFYGRSCYAETPAVLYRCPGVPVTDYWGGHFMRSTDELPVSRSTSKNQWEVDNNGFLVPVGLDPVTGQPNHWYEGVKKALWGTVVNIDGIGYNWGVPQLQFSDSTGTTTFKKIGNWQPAFEYGWTNKFNKGNLQALVQVGGQVGGDIYNRSQRDLYSSLDHPDAVQTGIPDSLKKGVEYYSGGGTGSLGTGTYNDYFVQHNASFMKVREAQVAYTLDAKKYHWLNKAGASRATVSLDGRDLWLFMPGYKGLDPEGFISLNGGINTRMDILRYPPGRRFTGSFSLVF